jgi:hypothetical protein
VLLHLLLSGGVLFAPAPYRAIVQDYLLHGLPLVAADLLIRREALRLFRHPSVPVVVPLRALSLIYFTWPVYNLAWLMAVLRLPLSFRPTPKAPIGGLNPVWLLPQCVACLGMIVGLAITLGDRSSPPVDTLVFFVATQVALQGALTLSWLRWRRHLLLQPAPTPPAWDHLSDP